MYAVMRVIWYKEYRLEIGLAAQSKDGQFTWHVGMTNGDLPHVRYSDPEKQDLPFNDYAVTSINKINMDTFKLLFRNVPPEAMPSRDDYIALSYAFGQALAEIQQCRGGVRDISYDIMELSGYSQMWEGQNKDLVNGYNFEEFVLPKRRAEEAEQTGQGGFLNGDS